MVLRGCGFLLAKRIDWKCREVFSPLEHREKLAVVYHMDRFSIAENDASVTETWKMYECSGKLKILPRSDRKIDPFLFSEYY